MPKGGISLLTVQDRIYGLSVLWKEADYNFALWDKCPDINWDLEYQEFLTKVIEVDDDLHYYSLLMEFISLLRDGHSYVLMPDYLKPPYQVPIGTTYVSGKHILCSLPKDCGVKPYGEILSINGILTEEYLKKYAYPYIWHELPDSQFKQGLFGYIISCCERGHVQLETTNGIIHFEKSENSNAIEQVGEVSLKHPMYSEAKTYYDSENFRIKITNNEIGILDIFTFGNDNLQQQIIENLSILGKCKGFVIDVRDNGGGSDDNVEAVVRAFIRGPIQGLCTETLIHNAAFKAYGQYRAIHDLDLANPWNKKIYDACTHRLYETLQNPITLPESAIHLSVPVVILCNSTSACATEIFIILMRYAKRATIVGTTTYGSCGQPYMGALPGGGRYGICTTRTYLPSGGEFVNKGVSPDIYAEISVEDYLNGFDSVLDKGLQILSSLIE